MTRSGSTGGFTLIEVLAAFVLIAIVLPTIARGVSTCVKAETGARELLLAATLADAKLNELITDPTVQSGAMSGTFAPGHPDIRWSAMAVTSYEDYLMEVMLVVTWPDIGGERDYSISTLYYGGSLDSEESAQ